MNTPDGASHAFSLPERQAVYRAIHERATCATSAAATVADDLLQRLL